MAGTGGKRVGAGRKPNTIKGLLKKVAPTTAAVILSEINEHKTWVELGRDKDPRVRLEVLKYLTDKRDGKAAQTVKMDGNITIDPGERAARLAEIAASISAEGSAKAR